MAGSWPSACGPNVPKLKIIFTSGYSADVVGKDFVPAPRTELSPKAFTNLTKLALTVRDLPGRSEFGELTSVFPARIAASPGLLFIG